MARRLRVPFGPLTAGEHELRGPEAKYLTRVHRMAPGDTFVAFDPSVALEADAIVSAVSKEALSFQLRAPRPATRLPRSAVTLIQALGKADKPDRVIRDATALGAARVVLVESARVVPRLADRSPRRRERFERIAVEAARQCGRGDVPRIDGPEAFERALEGTDATQARFTLDPEGARTLPLALSAAGVAQEVVLLIGPEGGFTDSERDQASAAGFEAVRLGPFILRTETAAVAALAVVAARW